MNIGVANEHSPNLAVIIPCLDEGQVIGDHVRDVIETLGSMRADIGSARVFVVDNGSTDDTAQQARSAGAEVVSEPRRGYGRACLRGAEYAEEFDILVFMDGDRSDLPAEIPVVAKPVLAGTADLVVGSRTMGRHESGSLTIPQRTGNWLACRGLGLIYGVDVSDFGPFRAIRRNDLLALGMQEMTYGWPLEMLARSGRRGLRIENVPTTWRNRAGGISKVSGNFRASVRTANRYAATLYRCR